MSTEWVIGPAVVASVAAHAALGTAGVARLEPGVGALVGGWSRAARQQVLGLTPAPAEGVTVAEDLVVRVSVSVRGPESAALVGQAVQRSVVRAVEAATGVVVPAVLVSIVDIAVVPV
ncbi:Asp23/Gls24 family envelope stress response protein [Fodinicola feengrottensis]|uniref:Asp23/Gls24 family envelope stress response protein n=1 Tax=Fodinicola feengrottensis TaxID=435914 RepID=A0ABN2J181_9ACTN|nr:Asp23/Gls24 family envelope stress response protein [Fodinicola feengrottensis]